jgi:hypothetical protein
MARNKKHINDKFYTKEDTAKRLIDISNIDDYDTVIEPSAGAGAFSNNIKHKNLISLDIDPENSNIVKMDWFDFSIEKKGRILVIGNPPFGNQGGLALKFIKKCDDLKIDTIAFILPKSFKKDSVQNRIPLNYYLIKEIDLDASSFELNGVDYGVPSVFQIWERRDKERDLVKMKTKSNLISFVSKNDNPDYSFRRVGFYAGKIFDDVLDKSEQSHYFVKSSNEIRNFLEKYNWEHNNTAGPRSIGKSEIIKLIENENPLI